MQDSQALFTPLTIGSLTLPNRIVMAPLTRNRADHATDAQGELNARYYAQRASAGLLISEATQISPQGKGYAYTPGIYSKEQIAGWKVVTDAVHAAGGRMFAQLWHVGRISHPSLQPDGALPVAPSAIKPEGAKTFNETGFVDIETPRTLELGELPGIIADYVHAAKSAIEAGFDGVEIHGANGYLLDQFMRQSSNHRTDAYGGSIENRARLLLEVMEATTHAIGSKRVGLRISPVTPVHDMRDDDPAKLFGYVVDALNRLDLAYLHVVEGATGGSRTIPGVDYADLRARFHGIYMANNGYDRALAIDAVKSGRADLVAFGRTFIANPDLVERLRTGAPLALGNVSTYYGGGEAGYTDYPSLDEEALATR